MRSVRRQRGTVYVLVLGITTLLVAMGVAGAMLARVANERSNLEQDQAKARLLALSMFDIRHGQIDGYTLWRAFVTNDTWDGWQTLGDGQVRSKYLDEVDGDIKNWGGEDQPFRLYVEAQVGDAVRVYSQEFIVGDSNVLIRNPKSLRQEQAD